MGDCCCKKGVYTATATEDNDFQHVDGKGTLSITDRYLKAEYMAMARASNGMLTRDQFVKLLMFLGYGGEGQAEALVKAVNKDENAVITLDEYYDAMKNNPEVMQKTSMMRNLFGRFDDNKDGKARRDQIEQGFRDMGVEVDDKMKKDIAKMDENHDGNVFYQDFVHTQLKNKGYIS
ncbi:calcium-dependent protein kinase 12-like isoform X1 [Mizuhopecten yessoensis]|uniref:calcium-dependent protein kinase 12-like isoform X1 n=1 Tax=Mizuhopecten yessoensis TaxID=6573 RepID=UPI000B45F67C|nr:calcium-dependent protein kinase 12-like isoform X1 [Mizuhopecten yessoensis]